MKREQYTLAAIYDTETCNIGNGTATRAYPVLFIDNDIRGVDLASYTPVEDDKVNFYRYEDEYLARLDEYIHWGAFFQKVPVVCAYNLMFDLQPLMEKLNQKYKIEANAQSSTNIYTLDLLSVDTNKKLLRFWDTYHLEMRGLKAMGKTCGLAKAMGDWDYSLIRTPKTELTTDELFYAARDVQVIPAYLRYLLDANEWLSPDDFGCKVLTKTSLVRQMAKHTIAPLRIEKQNGKNITLEKAFLNTCEQELPKTFQIYALRKSCFRGGFTFTAAKTANEVVRNVASLDVTSMHHTFINGRYTPMQFKEVYPDILEHDYKQVTESTVEDVLHRYQQPFDCAFHMVIRMNNIRLKKDSPFEKWGIALESSAKFTKEVTPGIDIGFDPKNVAQENIVRDYGFFDRYKNAIFAFGKLYEAESVTMHVNELELWCMFQVYEWDSHEILYGEHTISWKIPPDYVTLQSNILYRMKNDAKFINNHYKEGTPYFYEIPSTIPNGISDSLKNGTCTNHFFEAWYVSTVKGQFNGIYGTQAQDVYKPSYMCTEGELMIDAKTVTSEDNWAERQPKGCKVFYNYGARIVGGSRMHLVIAIMLLDNALKDRVKITAGDTDSLKVACDYDVTDEDLLNALEPLKTASKNAIDKCMERMRGQWVEFASGLNGVGSFDVERAYKTNRWDYHMEAWNKARISVEDGHVHIVCAGLSRPEGTYTIENYVAELLEAGYQTEDVLKNVLGYNVHVSNEICHSLEGHKPRASDVYVGDVTDYTGKTSHVESHESQALYSVDRILGETCKPSNAQNVVYMRDKLGRLPDTSLRYLRRLNGCAVLEQQNENGLSVIMDGTIYE